LVNTSSARRVGDRVDRVDYMTVFEAVGAPKMELPEEPVDIKEGLRGALLAGQKWRDGLSDEICIVLWLWGLWRPALEPSGMTREEFVDLVSDDRRELWLWLMGERQWFPFITGLAGRVVRRLPAVA
jgi:hypothetical protein